MTHGARMFILLLVGTSYLEASEIWQSVGFFFLDGAIVRQSEIRRFFVSQVGWVWDILGEASPYEINC